MAAIVRCEDVSKVYPSGGRNGSIHALERVSMEVAQHEFVSIVGPSGCGKSTLLKLIAGFEHVTSGSITVNGDEVRGPGADRVVVFQQPALYPWLTVSENVAFGLKLRKISHKEMESRVNYFLERVGLLPFGEARPYELSGGMQQRVAIVRALIVEPAIVLMDEPFGALDAQTRTSMQDFLLELWQEIKAAVIFVTHDISEAILLGDRVIVMDPHPGTIRHEEVIALERPRQTSIELTDSFATVRRHMAVELGAGARA